MTTILLSRSLFTRPLFFLAFLLGASALVAQMAPGDAVILRVVGEARVIRSGMSATDAVSLKVRDKIREGDRVLTGSAPSSISLVFSNGSNLTLRSNSNLLFQELAQIPFQAGPGGSYGSLPAEPTESRTLMKLDSGEVVGEVRGLNRLSLFEVATEVGTAGIRGTIFGVKIQRDGNTWRLDVTNADGTVYYYSDVLGVATADLGAEEAASIEAQYDSETGEFSLTNSEELALSAETLSQIIDEVEEITNEAEESFSDGNGGGGEQDSGDDEDPIGSPS